MKLLSCHSTMRLQFLFLSEILIFQMKLQQIQMWYTIYRKAYCLPWRNIWNMWRPNWIIINIKNIPWITMGIINSIKFRDKICKRLRLTNCDSPMYETLEKTSRITIASSKEIYMLLIFFYYESKFHEYTSHIKQTWTTINELLNKCNNKK